MEVRKQERGFSLVEVLIASAIFLIIALGVLPLFAQAIRSNLSGRDATDVSNLARSRVEELLQVPFETLIVPAGKTEGVTKEYWSATTKAWAAGTPTAGNALWYRTTTIRQFSFNDLQDNGIADTPLPGDTPVGNVHFKEIVVEVRNTPRTLLSGGGAVTVRRLRAV
ncbi:MAG TPA: prepilin-type N-terminal cleavage/methylation domain-containing protein [Thermoanaerobaculia bacterium]|jgi:prepilin-type N-terminal cleavage/methylation domain-containing protein|nr:prepilin-type N-terminal cleavage/methylation domain-containing protein [Thermoanaerobaculia bacterium]